ncbi:Guanine-nucleotide dissociation stimulator CDC25 [Penicillium chermesinum]|uniref:Guanine-nucleotide dissociation stimulator CDC25 n=1 Tax=Penicillium chermesinum TaxID=63820 RepID=A0A9W9P962_9EURO|nr:Guanine-nucleotide dissociation stimulator CDC25 [Penicillium chermesinum]KAJ5240183.1 Guanine-nucleotide dissociation stimulator CDC25 [Penicillium chermesinum]
MAPFASIDQVASENLQPQRRAIVHDDPLRWSSSQLSELRPREAEDVESVMTDNQPESIPSSHPRRRANSISTISEQRSVGGGNRGELRIVIDRSEDQPGSAGGKSPDTALEVPIPHYRLGSPRFNQEGSATLQSSVYTRNSTSDNFRNSTLLGGMVDPMPARIHGPYSRDSTSRNRSSFAVSMFSGAAAAIDLSRASPLPRNSIVYELKEPVEPSIYENLVSEMDDEAVVRYIPGTKDISAATPARIVAQVSSESFMDYELVSDFFLTFRSYLSTDHLLALLLARLQWAINRPQDDGRIIRIRTFAALRHWILNYFVDDFVTSYELRQTFCETINALYQEVKSRQNGCMSDLKILIDLKRCWNGKCSVYWGSSDFSQAYNDPDSHIIPGDTEVDILSSAEIPHQTVPLSASASAFPADTSSKENLPSTHHERNDSAGTGQSIPVSSKSEQSIMALSCSLPPRSPRRQSGSYKGKAPRPIFFGLSKSVSPHERPPTSPIISRHPFPGHSHKRSGSFSDSVRDDRLPMSATDHGSTDHVVQEALDPVRLIRGVLYPPC